MDRAGDEAEKIAWKEAIRWTAVRSADREACCEKISLGLKNVSDATKSHLFDILPELGETKALALLVEAANGKVASLRDAATRSLGVWNGPEVAEPLYALTKKFKSENDVRLHRRTLRGLIRILRRFDIPRRERLEYAKGALEIADRDEEKIMLNEIIERWGGNAIALFDGKTFEGWEGDTEKSFRIEDGAIVGGSLDAPVPRNEFLCTKKSYRNFVLTIECKLAGEGCNAGVQFRSQRIPNNNEVLGYQADMDYMDVGCRYWGTLFDESRRGQLMASDFDRLEPLINKTGWNVYTIRCEDHRIRLYVNGLQTVDYVEQDETISQEGIIGLQIHGGPPAEAWYRSIVIEELD